MLLFPTMVVGAVVLLAWARSELRKDADWQAEQDRLEIAEYEIFFEGMRNA